MAAIAATYRVQATRVQCVVCCLHRYYGTVLVFVVEHRAYYMYLDLDEQAKIQKMSLLVPRVVFS